ncbi:uncharacterized protein B0H18DRAFT_1210022 [Fomitopsis serialis]|uniref:uncharacterized protein n=1 Tax=Fomitopsis serialis TaxID=139415 RepID=UPI002007BA8A|nr:uncharacterized protein B0H18DRAFT_1210022 [Neoantrodia serialis]KAH9928831.1 hypothetical protein B0H18DRAFT_1210022 [Neoantrodia serialis]
MNSNQDFRLSDLFLVGQATSRTFGDLCLKPSLRNPISTTKRSVSQPSNTVKAAVRKDFAKLYCGEHIIDRLQGYIDFSHNLPGRLPSEPAPTQPYRARAAPGKDRVLPPTSQITEAVGQMYQEEMRLRQHSPLPLTTNDSVQDEVGHQILPLLNHAIKTYTHNTIIPGNLPPHSERTDSTQRDHFEEVNASEAVNIDVAQQLLFFPCWARHAIGSLQWEQAEETAGKASSGKADYALFISPALDGVCAHGEVRQPWIYTTREIHEVYTGPEWAVMPTAPYNFQRGSGFERTKAINSLLKMAFGQIRGLNSHIGFFTNLSVVVFYFYFDGKPVKEVSDGDDVADNSDSSTSLEEAPPQLQLRSRRSTRMRSKVEEHADKKLGNTVPKLDDTKAEPEPEPEVDSDSESDDLKSGLVLSYPIDFTDPRVLLCLQAMTFLALDAQKWDDDGKRIVDILAPGDELTQIRPVNAQE